MNVKPFKTSIYVCAFIACMLVLATFNASLVVATTSTPADDNTVIDENTAISPDAHPSSDDRRGVGLKSIINHLVLPHIRTIISERMIHSNGDSDSPIAATDATKVKITPKIIDNTEGDDDDATTTEDDSYSDDGDVTMEPTQLPQFPPPDTYCMLQETYADCVNSFEAGSPCWSCSNGYPGEWVCAPLGDAGFIMAMGLGYVCHTDCPLCDIWPYNVAPGTPNVPDAE